MLQNKIYQGFIIEIFKNFFLILFGLSLIALTVRAVSFLDLVVENGYLISTYFKYSSLNFFGIAPKFIPLSFLLSLTLFILKHIQDSEFIILWTSGVKKTSIVNLFVLVSLAVVIINLLFSTFITPLALNKSRQLLGNNNFNSFLPTIQSQQFNDSFKNFTIIVEKKINNEVKNVFINDTGNNLKNLSPDISQTTDVTILANKGIIENKRFVLLDGQIISSKNQSNDILKFEQLNIDLNNLNTSTIKQPKIQETSTKALSECIFFNTFDNKLCNNEFKKEAISTLSRRIIIPLYIPVIALICSFLLIKSNKIYLNKINIFLYSFLLLLFTELAVKFTGLNNYLMMLFIFIPIGLILLFYTILYYKFLSEN